MLGKGCTWDLLYELSGVSAEVHRKWTLVFLAKFSTELYPIYVHGPRNNEELNKITSLYAACGFPGCAGSTDFVCRGKLSEGKVVLLSGRLPSETGNTITHLLLMK
jgi:hypothetical protein